MVNMALKGAIIERYGTQADFAAAIGASEVVVSRVIRGRRELTDDEKHRWARVLHVKVDELFGATTT